MISLLQIRNYIKQQHAATLSMVAGYFNLEIELARDLLQHLVRCNKVRRLVRETSCDGCQQCDKAGTEWFEVVV